MIIEEAATFGKILPHRSPLVGLDCGRKSIGVAVSDADGQIASPLRTIRRRGFVKDVRQLLDIVHYRSVLGVVIGLPRNMDGSEGPSCQSIRSFALNLTECTNLPITFWDERLSTVAAEKALIAAGASRRKRSRVIDHVAAALILQGLLDYLGNQNR
ncbi:MAG: Holliday junction resolvase RuvX [Aestuariivita sp.]|nr:Holliday junction resolvase RuvX [Aestuariivita sp.]MCY4203681.1 Holliday junction resolvase RuvX [Aestuariivita sp.]MCY4287013.1 Holliday junction resolvase RuvX [Aestuariivita sp.]MCY4347660.1 Holliday junction resolvase RuvX [Aestuariivita sp.]